MDQTLFPLATALMLPSLPLAAIVTETGSRTVYPLILMVLLGCWTILLGNVIAVRPAIRRETLPTGRPAPVALTLAAIMLLGIAFRLWFSPLEPMLSTYSGLGHVTDAYKIAAFDWAGPFQPAYPLAVQALAGMVMTIAGRSPEVFFYVVGAISLLMIPALYVIGRLLWGRPHEGLVAALLAAVFPPFLLFATSGSLSLPYASLACVSIALLMLWLQTGRTSLLVALLTALVLTLQTRTEAALFIVPVVATSLLYPHRLPWKTLLSGRTISLIAAFLVLAIPYLTSLFAQVNSELSGSRDGGWSGMAEWLAFSTLVMGMFYAWGMHHQRKQLGSLSWGVLGLCITYLVTLQLLDNAWGLSNCFPGSEYLYTIPGADSFAPVGLMFIEPLLTPAGLTVAYFAAFATLNIGRSRRLWLLLNIWFIPLVGITFVKAAGELPFCGARTALAAAPPFLLLAAAGLVSAGTALGAFTASRRLRGALIGALVLGVAASFVAPLVATTSGPFNQQQEYHFVRGWISTLEQGSLLAYNNGPVETSGSDESCGPEPASVSPGETVNIAVLNRTDGLLTSLLGSNPQGIVTLGIETPDSLRNALGNQPVYYYEGLDCWRTGRPDMMPLCSEIHRLYNLEEVASLEFENRLYGSDFLEALRIDLETVRLTLYRVLPQ